MKIFLFWFNFHWSLFLGDSINDRSSLFQVTAWHLFGAKPLPDSMMSQDYTAFCGH